MKKKTLIIGTVIVALGLVGTFAACSKEKKEDVKVKESENIYLYNKTKLEGVTDISVYQDDEVINLGNTTLGFVKYIPQNGKYLTAEPDKEDDLKSNLILVNKDESRIKVASIVTNMISKVEVINQYLFYKDSEMGHYTAVNLNEERMDKQIPLEKASKIVTSVGAYVYYLDSNDDLYSYNFDTKEVKEVVKKCKSEDVFGDNIVITQGDGSLYYYNTKTNELVKDDYKVSEGVKIKDDMQPITLMTNFEGDELVYKVPKPRQTGLYDLYLKAKNQKPELIAADVNQVKVFGNDCFVNTLITAENKKFTGEVKYINLDKPSDAKVISNVYLSVDKMEKATDGTYYMSYSDIADDTPEMFSERGSLFKYNAGNEKAQRVATSVADFAVEGNNIVYAKVNSLTQWDGKYNVYINDRKVATGVSYAAIKGSVPIYEGEDGYLYLVKDGQPQMSDVKVHDYNSILN
ncbi:MAG: hypothetical protein ACRCWG_06795 [Sarcina sp.]